MKCPHCLVSFHDSWSSWACHGRAVPSDCKAEFQLSSTVCPACMQLIFRMRRAPLRLVTPTGKTGNMVSFTETILYPKGTARPIPPEVDEEFADDFREACLVIGDSEKASAALSRRCLQNLLREKAKTKAKNLAEQIQEVIDSGKLPSPLADAIDGVRAIGNFAAHPVKSKHTGEVIEVEPGEAEWTLDTLEGLFDFYFVQPAKLEKKRDALDKKLEAAGKPPLKGVDCEK